MSCGTIFLLLLALKFYNYLFVPVLQYCLSEISSKFLSDSLFCEPREVDPGEFQQGIEETLLPLTPVVCYSVTIGG